MVTINKVLMVGRVVRAPEMVERNNFKFAKLTIVTEHTPKGRGGSSFAKAPADREEKKEVCYLDCTVWNQEAELAVKYLSAGSVIAVEGRLKLEKWMDKATNLERTKHVLVADTLTFMEKIKTDDQSSVRDVTERAPARDNLIRPEPTKQFTKSAPAQGYAPRPVQKPVEVTPVNQELYDELPF